MAKTFVTCDCLGSQTVDSARLSELTGAEVRPACSALCMDQLDLAAKALSEGDVVICCAQEAKRFEALAEDIGVDPAPTLDLRDRAGWNSATVDATPKMAALMAEALLPISSSTSTQAAQAAQA